MITTTDIEPQAGQVIEITWDQHVLRAVVHTPIDIDTPATAVLCSTHWYGIVDLHPLRWTVVHPADITVDDVLLLWEAWGTASAWGPEVTQAVADAFHAIYRQAPEGVQAAIDLHAAVQNQLRGVDEPTGTTRPQPRHAAWQHRPRAIRHRF